MWPAIGLIVDPRSFQENDEMKVLFVAGFGPIASDVAASGKFYRDTLDIAFEADGDYLHTGDVAGVKHLALWPLTQAAESCFGAPVWPAALPVPQSWIEFDVEDIEAATRELQDRGYTLLVAVRTEPWGQIVTRLLGPEGMLVGLTVTPSMRDGSD
jgi:predicted enzyme related to lactoylglutathione lyase